LAVIGTAPVTDTSSIYSGGSGYTFGPGTRFRLTWHGTQIKFLTPTYTGLGSAKITTEGQAGGSSSQLQVVVNGVSGSNSAVRYTSPAYPDGNHVTYFEFDPNDQGSGCSTTTRPL
jgi:hypothetical protein